jgi:hypothetical protein
VVAKIISSDLDHSTINTERPSVDVSCHEHLVQRSFSPIVDCETVAFILVDQLSTARPKIAPEIPKSAD